MCAAAASNTRRLAPTNHLPPFPLGAAFCLEIGFSPEGATATVNSAYGTDTSYWLSDLSCGGTETFAGCVTADSWGSDAALTCARSQAAGAKCSPSVRFRDSTAVSNGIVEVYTASQARWNPVRAAGWTARDGKNAAAQVLCRGMGLPTVGAQVYPTRVDSYLQTDTRIEALFDCSGGEATFTQCPNFYMYFSQNLDVLSVFCPVGGCQPALPPAAQGTDPAPPPVPQPACLALPTASAPSNSGTARGATCARTRGRRPTPAWRAGTSTAPTSRPQGTWCPTTAPTSTTGAGPTPTAPPTKRPAASPALLCATAPSPACATARARSTPSTRAAASVGAWSAQLPVRSRPPPQLPRAPLTCCRLPLPSPPLHRRRPRAVRGRGVGVAYGGHLFRGCRPSRVPGAGPALLAGALQQQQGRVGRPVRGAQPLRGRGGVPTAVRRPPLHVVVRAQDRFRGVPHRCVPAHAPSRLCTCTLTLAARPPAPSGPGGGHGLLQRHHQSVQRLPVPARVRELVDGGELPRCVASSPSQ